MDWMDSYKIRESIDDVVAILDGSEMGQDLFEVRNLVQLTNRVPIAHLAIERGLKALIAATGADPKQTHALNNLYRDLNYVDNQSGNFLADAFDDAVRFFGINANATGRGHFRSLDDYLSKVGTEKAFDALRYWVIDEPANRHNPIPFIFDPIHRELLCALSQLFELGPNETVSERVEHHVRYSMFQGRDMSYASDDTRKQLAVNGYMQWLQYQGTTYSQILKQAARRGFSVSGDAFIDNTLRTAHEDLRKANDPAVRYFASRITYLPERSQPRSPDIVPGVKWINDKKMNGIVVTGSGVCLGYVRRSADDAWGIEPSEPGLAQITDVAEKIADAQWYLVNRLTHQVDVSVNGEAKQLRIMGGKKFYFSSVSETGWNSLDELSIRRKLYELEFWDGDHGLNVGDNVEIKLYRKDYKGIVDVLRGDSVDVEGHKVSIKGWDSSHSL